MSSDWMTFFSSLATVAAALLALLFVSFQIARSRWISDILRKWVAIQTLLEFLVPVIFALIVLLPQARWKFASWNISGWQIGGVVVSLAGLATAVVITSYGATNWRSLDSFGKRQLRLQSFAFIEYVLFLLFSLRGHLALTSIICIWLLVSGSWEAWEFFSELD